LEFIIGANIDRLMAIVDSKSIAANAGNLLAPHQVRSRAQRGALEYRRTQALYCQGQPDFDALVARIHQHIGVM
jgi:hypothetical protein